MGSLETVESTSIRHLYPEFNLSSTHTTSLDPYTPIWALVPFFEKVVVGILPYLRDEQQFVDWYGVSVRQLLHLRDMGKVEIRVLFPSQNVVPKLVTPFFTDEFPSTIRDRLFVKTLLGNERIGALKERFRRVMSSTPKPPSLDGPVGNARRAFNTYEAVYLQLHAHGYEQKATEFEILHQMNPHAGSRWLELCRLLLLGPIHYSLLGIHTVSSNVPELVRPEDDATFEFPSELGRILVDALGLVAIHDEPDDFTLNDCLAVYDDFEQARETLSALHNAIRSGEEVGLVNSADELRELIRNARRRERNWLRVIRLVSATGLGVLTLPFDGGIGLLAGLGFGVATEFGGEYVDKTLRPVARKLPGAPPDHLALLIDLDDQIKRHFQLG